MSTDDYHGEIDHILDFWFGEIVDGLTTIDKGKLWFGGGSETDLLIESRFEHLVLLAEEGALSNWQTQPRSSLALILLLDQFPLNIYRKTARAFSFETPAIEVCKAGLNMEHDQALSVVERVFYYLPLEHSEDISDQQLSVSLFRQLDEQATDAQKKLTQGALDYALEHSSIIEKFGRYPYRNKVLGRASTELELEWIKNQPKTYGQ